MSDATDIHSAHPLFRELRCGLLWHCTSPEELFQIQACGFIKPNKSQIGKYGALRSACQALDGVSLFDFTTEPETRVLDTPFKWQQFLRCAKPLTVILGMEPCRLTGKLVRYPENRDITSSLKCSGPIPWVEVCHRGQISISSITRYLLVCAADLGQFRRFEVFNQTILTESLKICDEVAATQSRDRAPLFDVQKFNNSPEFKAKMEQIKRQIDKIKGQA
jgi:hypothetical protein